MNSTTTEHTPFSACSSTVVEHEAARATMRWLRGSRMTSLSLSDGEGRYNGGTGTTGSPQDELLVALAPLAWQGLDHDQPVIDVEADDIRTARTILAEFDWLRLDAFAYLRSGVRQGLTIDEALAYHVGRAQEELRPHRELVLRLAARLESHGHLPARSVRAIVRDYDRG